MYHSSCYETAVTKADTQRSGHFSGFSRNISRHLGSNGLHRFSVCITSLQSFSPFTLICPHPDPQLRRLDPESKRDTWLCEQQWRPFSLMWGAHGKSTRGFYPSQNWLGSENQNQDHFTLYLVKKSWVFLLGLQVWVPSPHLMWLLALYWFVPQLLDRACSRSLLQPRFHSKATSLMSKVTMVEFYTTVFLKNIPQFVIPKQNKIMHHSEKLVSHSEDV